MKKEIKVFDYANQILEALPKGILLTTKTEEKVNTMIIGWGTIGIEWGKPVFVAYVRESRFTKVQLDKNPEFTINIPLDTIDPTIFRVCGSKSGYDMDKIKDLNLTLEESNHISVPGIKELPLTLECKVIYQSFQDAKSLPAEIVDKFYPNVAHNPLLSGDVDAHIAYYGEILDAYILD